MSPEEVEIALTMFGQVENHDRGIPNASQGGVME